MAWEASAIVLSAVCLRSTTRLDHSPVYALHLRFSAMEVSQAARRCRTRVQFGAGDGTKYSPRRRDMTFASILALLQQPHRRHDRTRPLGHQQGRRPRLQSLLQWCVLCVAIVRMLTLSSPCADDLIAFPRPPVAPGSRLCIALLGYPHTSSVSITPPSPRPL